MFSIVSEPYTFKVSWLLIVYTTTCLEFPEIHMVFIILISITSHSYY
nr:MAG TPA: hypothetical protein [Caudoviricetes sp.]